MRHFYPRPPGGGRLATVFRTSKGQSISIHALRVEGDGKTTLPRSTTRDFYPRPPGGGRQRMTQRLGPCPQFLSTPSGWRATSVTRAEWADAGQFLSTPSGWRATKVSTGRSSSISISIHALRVEGDPRKSFEPEQIRLISIHALRVEGDRHVFGFFFCCGGISIHALRVEGDSKRPGSPFPPKRFLSTPSGWRATARGSPEAPRKLNFYPRPPGGGRPRRLRWWPHLFRFLSTPSGWRATKLRKVSRHDPRDFYPRPPGGGRLKGGGWLSWVRFDFYPRPPGGGRQQNLLSPSKYDLFLSTPSGWRATLCEACHNKMHPISIHALRVEGDPRWYNIDVKRKDFYPRPPGGGRLNLYERVKRGDVFLSTPSGWRATKTVLRGAGDRYDFYPRPPGGGRRTARNM